MLDRRSPVLEKLAELYASSEAGKTGAPKNGFGIRYENLLKAARCLSGERFANAVDDLDRGDGAILCLKRRRNLKSNPPTIVRVRIEHELGLFTAIGRTSPTDERAAWAKLSPPGGTGAGCAHHDRGSPSGRGRCRGAGGSRGGAGRAAAHQRCGTPSPARGSARTLGPIGWQGCIRIRRGGITKLEMLAHLGPHSLSASTLRLRAFTSPRFYLWNTGVNQLTMPTAIKTTALRRQLQPFVGVSCSVPP